MDDMSKSDHAVTVLHVLEDAGANGTGIHVRDMVEPTGLGETTIRKTLKELEAGGFAERVPDATTQWRAVSKHDDAPKARGRTKAETAETRGRPRDPEAQARDDRALELIKAGTGQVRDIAEEMNTTRGLAYLSVWRLKKLGLVRKEATGTRTPNYVPA